MCDSHTPQYPTTASRIQLGVQGLNPHAQLFIMKLVEIGELADTIDRIDVGRISIKVDRRWAESTIDKSP